MPESTEKHLRGGLVATFLDRPVLTIMASLAILLVGVLSFDRLPLQLAPDGMSSDTLRMMVPIQQAMPPREVEEKVLEPFEELLRTIPGIKSLRSTASSGSARFDIELENGLDPVLASAEVRDRVQRAMLVWPEEIDRYWTWREDASSAPLSFFQLLTPEKGGDWDFLIDEVIRPRIEAVDGVGRLDLWGMRDDTLRIWFDRRKLEEHRVQYGELLRKLADENFTVPIGELDNGSQRYLLRVDSKFRTRQEIANYPVRAGLAIKDIAEVRMVPEVRDSVARFDGRYTYTGTVTATAEANPVEASNNFHAALEELKLDPRLEGLDFRFLFDQGSMIEDSLQTLLSTSLQGAGLALLAIFLFLRRLRPTLVIALAIPMALMMAGIYMFFTGGSLNIISMAGMTMAVGMVVDNSVVVLENIRRHREEGESKRKACLYGTREVILPISMATMTTVVVIFPLMFMGSDARVRSALSAMGMPLSIALFGSLMVAILLMPSGLLHLGKGSIAAPPTSKQFRLSPVALLMGLNRRVLGWGLKHRHLTAVLGVLVLCSIQYPASNLDFFEEQGGPFRGGDVSVNLKIPKGRTLEQVDAEVKRYEDFLNERREEWRIEHVSTRFGRTSARFDILMFDEVEKAEVNILGDEIREAWPRRPGIEITMRDSGSSMGGDTSQEQELTNFVLRLWGPESDYLAVKAGEVQLKLESLPEVESVEIAGGEDNEEVFVEVDRDRLSDLRVQTQSLERTMSAGLRGMELTRFEEMGREIRLIAQYDAEDDPTLLDLKEFKVWSEGGEFQRLDDITDITFRQSLRQIERLDGKTQVTLVGKRRSGVATDAMSAKIREAMDEVVLPRGYSWSEASRTMDIQAQMDELRDAGILSITLVFLLMGILFESVILPGAILITIPFAILGAYWSLLFFYGGIDVMAAIGMLLLCGVVVNNVIVLLDYIERMRGQGLSRRDAIMEGTRIRLRPIIMTAVTTILGLMPMALFGESTGQGLSYVSMSIAVAGGLAFCTFFTAIAVPLAYTYLDDLSNWLRGIRIRGLAHAGSQVNSSAE
ncbi:MAG: efflux RND transporter permease subunit [Planctomycetota bacterium]|jgi:HAE1 family hydrophobic/amphiphilic exporter-1